MWQSRVHGNNILVTLPGCKEIIVISDAILIKGNAIVKIKTT